ncbi:hypothetical protein BURMUCF1_B0475 [Burkholderia multivorans ATCC BAA-247]|uniref:Uncharacterized protein n=1 Tax=Burkholderia multivorans CGD2 TaxID=513052 RepID=B9BPP4_9BURK|nr:hypothetical protein BURMUCGD2_6665 [Burkholderia multivorans CGD2]EEE13936.1 hypothetical protein BURMUCGD2M_6658 [Burkholderia multivorans CGD2M]EJO63124.1 hypothetical protein BURMUCF1_B0475 [Burkholderia multivorans ATCC BAA-247]
MGRQVRTRDKPGFAPGLSLFGRRGGERQRLAKRRARYGSAMSVSTQYCDPQWRH